MAKYKDRNLIILLKKDNKENPKSSDKKLKDILESIEIYGSPSAMFSIHKDDLAINKGSLNTYFYRHKETNLYENEKCIIRKIKVTPKDVDNEQ